MRIAEAHDAVDARKQALNYAFAIKAGLGVEMSVGKRMLAVFERRPGIFHAALTGFRPAWKAFKDITQGSTSLGELVRAHPLAQRALAAMDRRPAGAAEPPSAPASTADTGARDAGGAERSAGDESGA